MNRHALEQKQAPSRPGLRPDKRLAVTYRALSELKLDPMNPRRHDRGQIRQIARSRGYHQTSPAGQTQSRLRCLRWSSANKGRPSRP